MTDFPRGGASTLTPLEMRDIHDQVQQDLLFNPSDKPISTKKSKKSKRSRPSDQSIEGLDSVDSSKKLKPDVSFVDLLSFKKLSVGMTIIGVIKEINDIDLTISLPNQLTGFVSITEITKLITEKVEKVAKDELDEIPDLNLIFQIGQPIVCCIHQLEERKENASSKKRIELTMMPESVNANIQPADLIKGMTLPAMVLSQEDHGYILSMGIDGVTGFIKKSKFPTSLEPGAWVYCAVKEYEQDKRVVKLTTFDSKTYIPNSHAIVMECLKAGSHVQVVVKTITDNGLIVSFLGYFTGTLDWFNLGNIDSNSIETCFKTGQKLRACITYVDPEKKKIGLSLNDVFVQWSSSSIICNKNLEIGSVIEAAKVKRVDHHGLLLDIPQIGQGYVHISNLSDQKVERVDKKYKVDSVHRARVLGFDLCDGLVLVTFQESVIAQPIMRHSDIIVGSMIKGQILKVDTFGVIVAITSAIKGLCPPLHLSDAKITHPEKMFKVGTTMKFQILSVDVKTKRVILTHRKSMMNSKLPIISSYKVDPGLLSMGIITSVKDYGCIVHFYNNVHCLVPVSECSDQYIKNASDLFKIGQSIKCRILTVDSSEEKIRASFKLVGQGNSDAKNLIESLVVGSAVDGTVITIIPDGVVVELENSGIRGFLSKHHLTDHLQHSDKLLSYLKEGSILKEMIVISKDINQGQVHLSVKPWLVQTFRNNAIMKFEDLKVGMLLPGYVKNVIENACFVSFLGGLVAMANSHNVADTFVTNVIDHFEKGQSVIASVTKIDTDNFKIFISLKESVLSTSKSLKEFELLKLDSYFKERDIIHKNSIRSEISKQVMEWATQFNIGCSVEGTVKGIMPYGAIIDLSLGGSGLISNSSKGSHKAGQKISGQLLDIDISKKILDLKHKAESDVIIGNTDEATIQLVDSCKETVEAIVELVKEDICIFSIPSLNNAIAFSLSRGLNSKNVSFQKLKVGQQVRGVIASRTSESRILFIANPEREVSIKVLDTKRIIKNAVDPEIRCMEDLTLGRITFGKIQSIKPNQMNINVGANLKGRIHISEVFDEIPSNFEKPFKGYKTGEKIKVKVIGFHDAKSHKFLPFSHKNPVSQTVVELSIRPSELSLENYESSSDFEARRPSIDTIKIKDSYTGFVQNVDDKCIWLHIGPNLLGRVSWFNISKDPDVVSNVKQNFPTGLPVKCYVLSKDIEKNILDLSLIENNCLEDIQKGQVLIGKITRIDTDISVQIGQGMFAKAHITDLLDTFIKNPTDNFKTGQYVKCAVLSVDIKRNHIDVSLRPSKFESVDVQDPEIDDIKSIKPDSLVSGYIRSISEKGCFVSLGRNVTARVKITDLSDSYIKEYKSAFSVGQLVKGRILSVDYENEKLEMSMKQTMVDPETATARVLFSDLKKGMKVKGSVKAIEKYGIFIQISNSDVSGLCHISELSDVPVKKIEKLYSVGDSVKAVILDLVLEKKRVSFGLKSSYFNDMDIESVDGESDVESDAENEEEIIHDNEGDRMDIDEDCIISENGSDVPAVDDSESDVESEASGADEFTHNMHVDPLDISGFKWNAEPEHQEFSDDSDVEIDEVQEKKSKRAKKRSKREEEERITKKELALLQGDQAPEVADDYERLLLGSPNSSFIWIKYMAFQLQLTEIEKAREVAERALKTIHFRESQEKLNVWVAYLNLENSYGTTETLLKVFERAIAYNEPKTVYLNLARIYERTNKTEAADQLYQVMIKKFKESSKVWTGYGLFLLKHGKSEDARALLQKSVKSLPTRKHIKTVSSFGLMEFKKGDAERGRTIFEGMMSNYPKRVDLWSVYLDQEIIIGDIERIRRLFERVIHLKLSSRKMKFFFKKYLEFEKKSGTEDGQEHVKQEAIKYVERNSS